RIDQFELTWTGSTPKAKQKPFLVSKDHWFRPVDLKLGPDGAIYVADFYNRIIGHYEVPLDHPGPHPQRGRIRRLVYPGQDAGRKPAAPRADWTTATVAELIDDLGHPNLTVRTKATHQLVERGDKAAEALRGLLDAAAKDDDEAKAFRRAHALWVLHRLGQL